MLTTPNTHPPSIDPDCCCFERVRPNNRLIVEHTLPEMNQHTWYAMSQPTADKWARPTHSTRRTIGPRLAPLPAIDLHWVLITKTRPALKNRWPDRRSIWSTDSKHRKSSGRRPHARLVVLVPGSRSWCCWMTVKWDTQVFSSRDF